MAAPDEKPFRGSGPGGEPIQPLKIEAIMRPRAGVYEVVVVGDLDVVSLDDLKHMTRAGMESGYRTILRLDGINVFGAAATRAIAELLEEASHRSVDLSVRGAPSHVRAVFEIVGLSDERITHPSEPTGPLSPVVFDAVVAAGALRTRESVCVTNADPADPRIVFVNEAFTALTGYRADEVLGASPRLLQGPLTDRAVLARLKQNLREGDDFNGEAVNYRSDRSPFWMSWRVIGIEYGAHRYYMALQRDGTEMRQLNRLDAARTRLTRLVNATNPPLSRSSVLEALSTAVASVIDPPEAVVAVVVADRGGEVVETSFEGGRVDTELLGPEQVTRFETDGSVSLQIPFDVAGPLIGHIVVRGIHPDWVRLMDIGQIVQLGQDSAHAVASARD